MENSNIQTLDDSDILPLQLDLNGSLKIRESGFGDLPVEILALVFSMVRSQKLSSSTTKSTTASAVMTLSHVNSLWRETCLSISSLWSHIHIIYASSNEAERIQMFLERSGNSLLTVDFCIPGNVFPYPPETDRMIRKLFAACGRWREASFSVEAHSLEHAGTILFGRGWTPQLAQRFDFPLLEKLSFNSPLESQSRRFLDIFQQKSTPRLQALVIPNYTTFLPFAFNQITSLNLLRTNQLLPPRLCPQLVRLEIGQTFGESNELLPPQDTATFELPRVETLIVSCSGPGRLWSMLTVPSLRNLVLKAITFMPLEYVAVLNMLRRSGCGLSLRKLTLAGMDVRDVDIESMLGLMPQLEEFVLQETRSRQQRILTPKFLVALKLSTSQELAQVIPDLAHIELHIYYHFPAFRLDLLFDMLVSRVVIPSGIPSSSLSASGPRSSSGALRCIHLCFILDADSPPTQVPIELKDMVHRLRLVSTSHIQSTVRCGHEWKREI